MHSDKFRGRSPALVFVSHCVWGCDPCVEVQEIAILLFRVKLLNVSFVYDASYTSLHSGNPKVQQADFGLRVEHVHSALGREGS